MKKKPVSIARNAHAPQDTHQTAAAAAAEGDAEQPPASGSWATASVDTPAWIQSIAVAPLSDLVASGAGDGFIRLWGVQPSKHGGAGTLKQVRRGGLLQCLLEVYAQGYVWGGVVAGCTGTSDFGGGGAAQQTWWRWYIAAGKTESESTLPESAWAVFPMAHLIAHDSRSPSVQRTAIANRLAVAACNGPTHPTLVHCCFVVQVGALPAAGYVNGLALGKSGTLAVAALGQVSVSLMVYQVHQ